MSAESALENNKRADTRKNREIKTVRAHPNPIHRGMCTERVICSRGAKTKIND